MSTYSAETPRWQSLWIKAREARMTGAVGRALTLLEQSLAEDPPVAEPYAEAADVALLIENGLASLAGLYERHRAAFGLSPNDMSFRPERFPIDGKGLDQALRWLETAAAMDKTDPTYLERLAELLEELDRLDEALACRRRLARQFPTIEANCAAIAILLERTGATTAALNYSEGLLDRRGTVEPALALCLARLYEHVGRHEDAELLGERLADTVVQAGTEASAMQFRLAWSAIHYGLPKVAQWPEALLRQTIATAQLPDASIEASLAAGLAASIFGDENSSRKYFVTACWKACEQFYALTPPDASRELRHALNNAARKAFDLAPSLKANSEAPMAMRHLVLACAQRSRDENSVTENMRRFDKAFAAIFNLSKDGMFEPADASIYRGYRIVEHHGQYYAIPATLTDYTIILGTVYRLPRAVRTAAALCPPRIRRSVRRSLAARYQALKPRAGTALTGRRAPPLLQRVLSKSFGFFTIHDVATTTDVAALYRQIESMLRTRNALDQR